MSTSVVIISVYIGKFPYFFKYVKQTMLTNTEFDFFIFTDQVQQIVIEQNITFIPTTLKDISDRLTICLGVNIVVPCSYKLADTKPAWADIFYEHVQAYEWWSWSDLDILFGDLKKFYKPEYFKSSDIIAAITEDSKLHGPLTFIKMCHREVYKKIKDVAKYIQEYSEINENKTHYIDEVMFLPVLKELNLKVTNKIINENNKKIDFIRYGRRRTPAQWRDGKVHMLTYRLDYPGQRVFDGFYDESSLYHIRTTRGHRVSRDLRVYGKHDTKYEVHRNFRVTNQKFTRLGTPYLHVVDNVILMDLPLSGENSHLANYYHNLIDYYPTLCEFIDERKYLIIFRRKASKRVFLKLLLNEVSHRNFYFKHIFKNITVADMNELEGVEIKNLIHIQRPKKSELKKLDLQYIERKLIEIPEPENFKTYENILIQRKPTNSSKVNKRLIDPRICRYLILQGYVEVYLEDFTPSQQAKLFKAAHNIVALHGAALANIIFCNPQTKIYELNTGFNVSCYPALHVFNEKIKSNLIQIISPEYLIRKQLTDKDCKCQPFYCPLYILKKYIPQISKESVPNHITPLHVKCSSGFNDFLGALFCGMVTVRQRSENHTKIPTTITSFSWHEFSDYFTSNLLDFKPQRDFDFSTNHYTEEVSLGVFNYSELFTDTIITLKPHIKSLVKECYNTLNNGDYIAICFQLGDYMREPQDYTNFFNRYNQIIEGYVNFYKDTNTKILLCSDDPYLVQKWNDNNTVYNFTIFKTVNAEKLRQTTDMLHVASQETLVSLGLSKYEVHVSTIIEYYLMLLCRVLIVSERGQYSKGAERVREGFRLKGLPPTILLD